MTCCTDTYQVKSEIYYGLITLIELADKHYQQGETLSAISEKYKIPIPKLSSIARSLELMNLVSITDDKLALKEEPEGFWIIRSSTILKNHFIKK